MSEMDPHETRAAVLARPNCEPAQVRLAIELAGRLPVEQAFGLPGGEALSKHEVTVMADDPAVVLCHKAINLVNQRENRYFVLHPEADPPRLDYAVDDLTAEHELEDQGRFDLIAGYHKIAIEHAATVAAPAEPVIADHLNQLFRLLQPR